MLQRAFHTHISTFPKHGDFIFIRKTSCYNVTRLVSPKKVINGDDTYGLWVTHSGQAVVTQHMISNSEGLGYHGSDTIGPGEERCAATSDGKEESCHWRQKTFHDLLYNAMSRK